MNAFKLIMASLGFLMFLRGLVLAWKDFKNPDRGLFKKSIIWLLVGTTLELIPWLVVSGSE